MKTFADYIAHDEAICGGEPRIRGTRIPVRTIIESIRLSHAKDPLLEAFPDITLADIDAALIYYAEHAEEIEQYIHEHRMAEEDTAGVPQVLKPPEGVPLLSCLNAQ